MTLKKLKGYQDKLAEIESLTQKSADSVKASLHNFPYTMQTVRLSASDDFINPSPAKLDKLAKLRSEKREIENWIETLPFRVKKIAWLYANGEQWKDIAAELKNETPDSARKKLARAIKMY